MLPTRENFSFSGLERPRAEAASSSSGHRQRKPPGRGGPLKGQTMTEISDTRDRVIRVEADLAHALKTIDGMNTKVTAMHELMLQGKGAAKASRWIGHGLTVVVAFLVSQLGGYFHLPR